MISQVVKLFLFHAQFIFIIPSGLLTDFQVLWNGCESSLTLLSNRRNRDLCSESTKPHDFFFVVV